MQKSNYNLRVNSKEHYDKSGVGAADVSAYQLALSFFAPKDLSNRIVLNLGCGAGILDAILHRDIRPKQYIGIDFSPVLVRKAKARSKQFDFIVADAEHIPIRSETVDWLISTETVEHVVDFRAALRECYRVLRVTGVCIITTPNYRSMLRLVKKAFEWSRGVRYTMEQVVEHYFTADVLRAELTDVGFSNFEVRGINFKGNFALLKTVFVYLVGGILRKAGLYQRLSIDRCIRQGLWAPPMGVIAKGVKPYHNRYFGKFGTCIGIRAFKGKL